MKIHIATNQIGLELYTFTDLKEARRTHPNATIYSLDIDIPIDFLKATLLAKELEAKLLEQANQTRIQGLIDLLGCDRSTAVEILRRVIDENPEIHKPDKSVEVRRES